MEILTLKGNGKSKLLMQLMNQCESKRALMIIYKGRMFLKVGFHMAVFVLKQMISNL